MPNYSYRRSAHREYEIKKKLEESGYYAIRSSGSHGMADVVGIKMASQDKITGKFLYEVRFIQVKTSKTFKEKSVTTRWENSLPIEYHCFPVSKKCKGYRNDKNN